MVQAGPRACPGQRDYGKGPGRNAIREAVGRAAGLQQRGKWRLLGNRIFKVSGAPGSYGDSKTLGRTLNFILRKIRST